MRKLALFAAVACSLVASSGCIAMHIASSGKDVRLCTDGESDATGSPHPVTRDKVHKELGKPAATWPDGDLQCEFFVFRGPIKPNDSDLQGFGWLYIFTFGLADIWMTPIEAINYVNAKQQKHEMTFWFDREGFVAGFYRGDFRKTPTDLPNWLPPRRTANGGKMYRGEYLAPGAMESDNSDLPHVAIVPSF